MGGWFEQDTGCRATNGQEWLEMNWFTSPWQFLSRNSQALKWSEQIPSACRSYLAIFVWRLYSKHQFFLGGGQYDSFNQSPGLDLEDTSHPMVCKQRKAKVPIRGGHRLSCPLLYLTGWKLYTGQSCNAQLLETSSLRFWDSFKLLHTYKYVCRRQSGQVVVWKGGKPHNKNIHGKYLGWRGLPVHPVASSDIFWSTIRITGCQYDPCWLCSRWLFMTPGFEFSKHKFPKITKTKLVVSPRRW